MPAVRPVRRVGLAVVAIATVASAIGRGGLGGEKATVIRRFGGGEQSRDDEECVGVGLEHSDEVSELLLVHDEVSESLSLTGVCLESWDTRSVCASVTPAEHVDVESVCTERHVMQLRHCRYERSA